MVWGLGDLGPVMMNMVFLRVPEYNENHPILISKTPKPELFGFFGSDLLGFLPWCSGFAARLRVSQDPDAPSHGTRMYSY